MHGVARTPSPDGITTPPGDYRSWDDYMADVERTAATWDRVGSLRVTKAMRLAPSVDVFCALLDGQPVPVEALDTQWRRRYRL